MFSRFPAPAANQHVNARTPWPLAGPGPCSGPISRCQPQPHNTFILRALAVADKPLTDGDEVIERWPVRVERIQFWQDAREDLMIPQEASPTSPRTTRKYQRSLAIHGTYLIQLKQLESVYLKARNLAAGGQGTAAKSAPAKRVELPRDAQKPSEQHGTSKPVLGSQHYQRSGHATRRPEKRSLPLELPKDAQKPSEQHGTSNSVLGSQHYQRSGHATRPERRSLPLPAPPLPAAPRPSHSEGRAVHRAGSSDLSASHNHPSLRQQQHELDRPSSRQAGQTPAAAATMHSGGSHAQRRAHYLGVRDILESMTSGTEALAGILSKVPPYSANQALVTLGREQRYNAVQQLAHAMMETGCTNEHSHAVIVSALDHAGRFDMAMQHFEDLCRKNMDIGPVCSSMMIKLCAQRRDLPLALDIFYRLTGHSTLNRFTYNCLIHLCAMLGQVDEAVNVLSIMHNDGGPDTSPDSFTYAEIVKAVVNSKRWKMLPRVYNEIRRSRLHLSSETWSLLITAAGRGDQFDLAKQIYSDAVQFHSGVGHIHNAILGALSRHLPLPEMLAIYRSMLEDGLQPDDYTFNAILSAMRQGGASLYAVEDLVGEMYKWNVKINTFTGTSLISAYKRAPELANADPRMTALLMEKVHDVLTQLVAQRQANSHTFGTVMAMHAHLGDAAGVQRLLVCMKNAGVALDGKTCLVVAKAFRNGGFEQVAEQFLRYTRTPGPEQRPKKSVQRTAW